MKIALVRCPGGAVDTPPIGIGYLTSSLKTKGHEVLPFDFNIEFYHYSSKQHALWETYNMFWQRDFDEQKEMFEKNAKKWARKILDTDAPVIGFSVFGANKILNVETARRIKEEEKGKSVPFYRRRWFWMAGGAAVAATVIVVLTGKSGSNRGKVVITGHLP